MLVSSTLGTILSAGGDIALSRKGYKVVGSDYFDGFFSDIKRLTIDEAAIIHFFFVFSRFEFALKATGYLKTSERASPDWGKFRAEVKDKYVPGMNEELDSAVAYLCEMPVGTQVSLGEGLEFVPTSRKEQTDIEFSIYSVEKIRNNLFHGGKFPSGPVTDPSRDARLLYSGLVVLTQCLE